jgi:hypothetical protein
MGGMRGRPYRLSTLGISGAESSGSVTDRSLYQVSSTEIVKVKIITINLMFCSRLLGKIKNNCCNVL